MPDYFDVRNMPPGTEDCIATRSINLMCALLKGITYRELYATPFFQPGGNSPVDTMIANIEGLHPDLQKGASIEDPIVVPLLAGNAGAFVKIRNELAKPGAPEILLGDLYTNSRQNSPQDPLNQLRNFVVDAFEDVHSETDDQMYHFCVPFVAIQLGRRGSRPSTGQFQRFISVLGDKTMQDFYDKPYTDEEKREAGAARQSGILKETRPKSSKPRVIRAEGQTGNGRWCVDGECCDAEAEDYWCSMVESGGQMVCALGSDTGTTCY